MLKTMQDYYYLLDTMRVFAKAHWRYLIIPKVALPNYPGLPLVRTSTYFCKEL